VYTLRRPAIHTPQFFALALRVGLGIVGALGLNYGRLGGPKAPALRPALPCAGDIAVIEIVIAHRIARERRKPKICSVPGFCT
jgi:hypothetical protein